MRHPRRIEIAGVTAALLANFWLLEFVLADHTDTASAWISDLASRTQSTGTLFQLLEIASGLAVAAFALLLLCEWRTGPRPTGPRLLRRGLWLLLAAGLLTTLGGAAPLNCSEALERTCDLSYDPFDLTHTVANLGEIIALASAFALVGLALTRHHASHRAGHLTLALGTTWLLLTAFSGLGYLVGDLDSVNGLCQRGAQLLFGGWLLLLGFWRTGVMDDEKGRG